VCDYTNVISAYQLTRFAPLTVIVTYLKDSLWEITVICMITELNDENIHVRCIVHMAVQFDLFERNQFIDNEMTESNICAKKRYGVSG
jgi:hypothetical protein